MSPAVRDGGNPWDAPERAEPSAAQEGLFNAVQTLHLLRVEFARARRYRHPLACLLISVDRLDERIDLLGAGIRERILRALRDHLLRSIRSSDFCGAHGRDRLLLLLTHTDLAGARLLASRLRVEMGGLGIPWENREIRVTLSMGLAATSDQELLFHETLLQQAEKALYLAEDRGGDRLEAWPCLPSGA